MKVLSHGEQSDFKNGHELNILHGMAVDGISMQNETQLSKGHQSEGKKWKNWMVIPITGYYKYHLYLPLKLQPLGVKISSVFYYLSIVCQI